MYEAVQNTGLKEPHQLVIAGFLPSTVAGWNIPIFSRKYTPEIYRNLTWIPKTAIFNTVGKLPYHREKSAKKSASIINRYLVVFFRPGSRFRGPSCGPGNRGPGVGTWPSNATFNHPYHPCMVYLPTFGRFNGNIW